VGVGESQTKHATTKTTDAGRNYCTASISISSQLFGSVLLPDHCYIFVPPPSTGVLFQNMLEVASFYRKVKGCSVLTAINAVLCCCCRHREVVLISIFFPICCWKLRISVCDIYLIYMCLRSPRQSINFIIGFNRIRKRRDEYENVANLDSQPAQRYTGTKNASRYDATYVKLIHCPKSDRDAILSQIVDIVETSKYLKV
jgi:hypothetical protein